MIFQTDSCKIISDAGCSLGSNAAPAYNSSDLMANPNPKSPKPDLAKAGFQIDNLSTISDWFKFIGQIQRFD